ncbi:MAG: hypothetical protein II719_03220, partial [Clostridia bacterium]|nr:hypothetical protein [Clostridia bacterium]
MKHFRILTAWIVLLAVTASLLSGCAGTDPSGNEETTAEPETVSEELSESESLPEETEEPATETETEEIPEPEVPSWETLWNPDLFLSNPIPDYCVRDENPALCDTGIRSGGETVPEVHGRYLHIFEQPGDPYKEWVEDEEFSVLVYELKTGEQKAHLTGKYYRLRGGLDNGGVWWVNAEGVLTLCDLSGSVTASLELGELFDGIRDTSYSLFDVSADGKYCAVLLNGNPNVSLFNLETGEKTEIDVGTTEPVSVKADGITLALGCEMESFYVIDRELSGYREVNYPIWELIWTDGSSTLVNHEDHAILHSADGMVCDTQIDCYGSYFREGILSGSTWENDQTAEYFFDLTRGICLGRLAFPAFHYSVVNFSSDGYVVVFLYVPGEDDHRGYSEIRYYLVDLNALSSGYTCQSFQYEEGHLNEMIDARIAELEAKTGIQIRYGGEGNDFQVSNYVGRASLNEVHNYLKVKELAEIFESYPDGMLREAAEAFNGIIVYLCDDLFGVGEGSIPTAGAITTEENGYIIMVYDITGIDGGDSLKNNVHHELSHVFDHKLQTLRLDIDEEWAEMSPAGSYTYSYSDYGDNDRYTIYGITSEVWFVDSYSKTFPTEDRARIMEKMYNLSEEDSGGVFAMYPNLRMKAEKY